MRNRYFIEIIMLICFVTLSTEYKVALIQSRFDDSHIIEISEKHINTMNNYPHLGTAIEFVTYTEDEAEKLIKSDSPDSPTEFVCNCASDKLDHYLSIVNNTNKMIWCLTPYAPYRCNRAFLPGVTPSNSVLYSM